MDSLHPQKLENEDSFEAIFALNMGEFVTEHLISDDLLDKINHSISNNPNRLKNQLEELVQIYSLDNTLRLLGFHSSQGFVLYDSMAMSLAEMFKVNACHLFQTMHKDDREHFLSLTGTSIPGVSQTRWNIGYELSSGTPSLMVDIYEEGFPAVVEEVASNTTTWKPLPDLMQHKVKSLLAVPLQEGQKRIGLVLFECYQPQEFTQETIDLVYYAGLLGSLGKIHIPQEILTKEEALTPQEMEKLRNSPNMGVGLLMKMNFLAEVIPYVDYQKERWDGKDSPHGLSGRSIPLGARIIAVADAYHALIQPRPYRESPLAEMDALKVLQSEAGTKWDPDVVDSLAKVCAASAS